MTALREANQVGHLQPTSLVSYEADIEAVFDGRDLAALRTKGIEARDLADPSWRDQIRDNGEARTQTLARRLIGAGYQCFLVRSFVPGAGPDDLNLVLWTSGTSEVAQLTLIDDENRLSR